MVSVLLLCVEKSRRSVWMSLAHDIFHFMSLRVYGAADPNSGTAALLEVAKGLGTLYTQHGWRPLRTIYLLSWSGEEYGLLGSTGWAELNANLISRSLAYLNVDTVVSGDRLKASASPSLTTLWRHVLNDLNNTKQHSVPFGNSPLGDVCDANTDWKWEDEELSSEIGILGSGSDYTVFLDHFGIPSLDFSFSKKTTYGQYHSTYDSFAWMDRFGGYEKKAGSAFDLIAFSSKIWGLLALRLATSEVVPLDHIAQGSALSKYVKAIQQQKVGVDLGDLSKAVTRYREAAAAVEIQCSNAASTSDETKCNEQLGLAERYFLLNEGLPERPWFRHVLQAPGIYLGYAAEAFPGVQQAIDEGNLKLAQKQSKVAAERIEAAANSLKGQAGRNLGQHHTGK
jgi:N-acetylated-alpha-linked acidic dipeptidase